LKGILPAMFAPLRWLSAGALAGTDALAGAFGVASKKIVVLDAGPAAAAGAGLRPLESSLPLQDAFLPVGHHCGPRDFEPAMGRAMEGLAVEVGDGQDICVGFADRARCCGHFSARSLGELALACALV
jgi:hypothetical protein